MSNASEGESPKGNHQEDEEEEEWEISIGTVKIVSTKHPIIYARSFPSVSLSDLSIFLSFCLFIVSIVSILLSFTSKLLFLLPPFLFHLYISLYRNVQYVCLLLKTTYVEIE